jgi:hypothetical protein
LSLRRTLSPPDSRPSPLFAGRGQAGRFATLDIPLPDLRVAAKAAGGTVNDAYLAGLLGGYRLYHEAMGVGAESIPMAVPLAMRRGRDPGGGNRIAGARFSGPLWITDPGRRIRAVRELILAARREPAIDTIGLLSPMFARLPGSVIARLVAPSTKGNDLQASYVPGPRGARYLAGSRVERVYPFAPRPGCPAMITLVTHGDVGCVGVHYDPASFTRPARFLRCLGDGFAEVLALQTRSPTVYVPRQSRPTRTRPRPADRVL